MVVDVSPGRGRRTSRPSGDDRERAILVTAERLLNERGLGGFSIDDLARGAGISRPTFYFYFASKDAVLLALFDRVIREAEARIAALPGDFSADPVGGWRSAIQVFVEVFSAHRAVAVAAAQAHPSNPDLRQLWSQTLQRWVHQAAVTIEAERRRGAAPPGMPAADLSIALNAMNERVLSATFAGEVPSIAEDRVVDVLLPIWLTGIYGTTTPAPAV
jgi:TetR/AcrR family transcriptional regulator, ethionamide resistance regulator